MLQELAINAVCVMAIVLCATVSAMLIGVVIHKGIEVFIDPARRISEASDRWHDEVRRHEATKQELRYCTSVIARQEKTIMEMDRKIASLLALNRQSETSHVPAPDVPQDPPSA